MPSGSHAYDSRPRRCVGGGVLGGRGGLVEQVCMRARMCAGASLCGRMRTPALSLSLSFSRTLALSISLFPSISQDRVE